MTDQRTQGSRVAARSRRSLVTGCLVAMAGAMAPSGASEWFVEPALQGSVIYTDNVNIASETDNDGDVVHVITPSIRIEREDDLLDLFVDYRLQSVGYLDDSEFNQVFQQLDSRLNTRLLQERVVVSAYGTLTQQVADPENPLIQNNIVQSGNRANALGSGASITFQENLGEATVLSVRQGINRLAFDRDELFDSTGLNTLVTLGNRPRQYGATWSFRGSLDTLDFGRDIPVTKFSTLQLELGYWLTESLRIFATGGVESDFIDHRFDVKYDTPIGSVGFQVVTPRDDLSLSVGERVFGTTINANWQHRLGEKLALSINYVEDAATNPQAFNGQQNLLAGLQQLLGGGGIGNLDEVALNDPRTANLFIRRRLSAGFRGNGNRLRFAINGFRESRRNQINLSGLPGGANQEAFGADVRVTLEAGARTTLQASGRYEDASFSFGNRTRRINAAFFADYSVSPKLDLLLRFDRFEGTGQGLDFTENRVTFTVERRLD